MQSNLTALQLCEVCKFYFEIFVVTFLADDCAVASDCIILEGVYF